LEVKKEKGLEKGGNFKADENRFGRGVGRVGAMTSWKLWEASNRRPGRISFVSLNLSRPYFYARKSRLIRREKSTTSAGKTSPACGPSEETSRKRRENRGIIIRNGGNRKAGDTKRGKQAVNISKILGPCRRATLWTSFICCYTTLKIPRLIRGFKKKKRTRN